MDRFGEQIIDVQKLCVEKIVKVPKIAQQVEDTQFRHSADGKNLKTGSSSEPVNKLRTVLKFKFLLHFQTSRYVTESMLTAKEENTASVNTNAKAGPRQKSTVTLTSPFLFLFLKGSGSILKHNHHMIMSVTMCQKLSPDCYDMINQSLGEATERSTTVTSSKSAG